MTCWPRFFELFVRLTPFLDVPFATELFVPLAEVLCAVDLPEVCFEAATLLLDEWCVELEVETPEEEAEEDAVVAGGSVEAATIAQGRPRKTTAQIPVCRHRRVRPLTCIWSPQH